MKEQHLNEIKGLLILALGIIIFLSLISFSPLDISQYTSHANTTPKNLIGFIGAYLAAGLFFLFGSVSFLVPLFILMEGFAKFRGEENHFVTFLRLFGLLILFIATSALLSTVFSSDEVLSFHRGGISGYFLSTFLITYIKYWGTYIILTTVILLCFIVTTGSLLFPIISSLSLNLKALLVVLKEKFSSKASGGFQLKQSLTSLKNKAMPTAQKTKNEKAKPPEESPKIKPVIVDNTEKKKPADIPFPKPVIKVKEEASKKPSKPAEIKQPVIDDTNYNLPTIDLLQDPPPIESRQLKEDLEASARILEGTLADFGIEVRVAQVERGPVLTRYELEPAPGVKIQRIVNLGDDIALAMKSPSVRIVAPIPGKARVGVEVPNSQGALVYIKEVLETADFQESDSKLTLALGKDIAGNPVVADLGEMPHLLIAGTTGSGKTVCVNGLIMSMLYQTTPSELKLIMVDPKMVELAPFNGLPHLLCPVLTDSKKVPGALFWVVDEMERRYKVLSEVSARNIDAYNEKIKKLNQENKDEGIEAAYEKMPYIVVIIDELADLMVVARAEIENAITRLAQLSRAVGIHLILATQRPSVDVITGVIKANFPARISFKVASKVDSRTVLDMNGADKLLGRGDMLFLKPGVAKLIRAQSSLVKDSEIDQVVNFIKGQAKPVYNQELLKDKSKSSLSKDGEADELFDEALRTILENNQASVSILQRRMRLGHARAARIIDMLEEQGIVGPYQGSKPREILVDRDSWLEKFRSQEVSEVLDAQEEVEDE